MPRELNDNLPDLFFESECSVSTADTGGNYNTTNTGDDRDIEPEQNEIDEKSSFNKKSLENLKDYYMKDCSNVEIDENHNEKNKKQNDAFLANFNELFKILISKILYNIENDSLDKKHKKFYIYLNEVIKSAKIKNFPKLIISLKSKKSYIIKKYLEINFLDLIFSRIENYEDQFYKPMKIKNDKNIKIDIIQKISFIREYYNANKIEIKKNLASSLDINLTYQCLMIQYENTPTKILEECLKNYFILKDYAYGKDFSNIYMQLKLNEIP